MSNLDPNTITTKRRMTASDLVVIYAGTVLEAEVVKFEGNLVEPRFHGLSKYESEAQKQHYAEMRIPGNTSHKELRRRVLQLINNELDVSGWKADRLFHFAHYFRGIKFSTMDLGIGNEYVLTLLENEYRHSRDPEHMLTLVKRLRDAINDTSVVVCDLKDFLGDDTMSDQECENIALDLRSAANSTYRFYNRTDPDKATDKGEYKLPQALDFWIDYLHRMIDQAEIKRLSDELKRNNEAKAELAVKVKRAGPEAAFAIAMTEHKNKIVNFMGMQKNRRKRTMTGAVEYNPNIAKLARFINDLVNDEFKVSDPELGDEEVSNKARGHIKGINHKEMIDAYLEVSEQAGRDMKYFLSSIDPKNS